MDDREFLFRARLEAEALEAWVAAGWLVAEGQEFGEIDVARAHLIHDLKGDIGVNDEGIGVILDLIDKLHGMRRTLGNLLLAIQAQPDEVRRRLIVSVGQTMAQHGSPSQSAQGEAAAGGDKQGV